MHSIRKLSWYERLELLRDKHDLSAQDLDLLKQSISKLEYADNSIENAIGYFPIPLGIVPNFMVNNKVYTLPIATEETSIIAALVNSSMYMKRAKAEVTSKKISSGKVGQVQIYNVKDFDKLTAYISLNEEKLIDLINSGPMRTMVARGGGVDSIVLRKVQNRQKFIAVITISANTCDAMGANILNCACEYLARHIEANTCEQVNISILANLNNDISISKIFVPNFPEKLGRKIEEASIFAETDPSRASTSNKGIMNGIDGLLIATGNDFRAVEASMHAYACIGGWYSSLSKWRFVDENLFGELKAPISVGTVGGATRHPIARILLKILNVASSEELSNLAAAVGLMQNFAALKALCSEGIVSGHMSLHIKNIVQSSDQIKDKKLAISKSLKILAQRGYISTSDIID